MATFDSSAGPGAVLTIDLDAIAANWRQLADLCAPAECGACVKADAYGLGVGRVATALSGAGCTTFFVADALEGAELRGILPKATIYVFNGVWAETAEALRTFRMIPVLNSLAQVETWQAQAANQSAGLAAALHIDTGMSRLGLEESEAAELAAHPERLKGLDVKLIMSHLACASEHKNPMNHRQLKRFQELRAPFGEIPASIANSSAIFLGKDYHLNLTRPGIAIYGGNPVSVDPNPMAETVRLRARILQVRDVDSPMTVGYGATHAVTKHTKIATISIGYADGFMRSLGNRGCAYIAGKPAPVVGRVSMDMVTLDVTGIPGNEAREGGYADVIGGAASLDGVAGNAGTVSYELLSRLGRRFHREYRGGRK